MIHHRLVIVGAGPAGMAAAVVAAEAGLRPVLIDEHPRVGGQIYRQPPAALASGATAPTHRAARRGAELPRRFQALADRMTVLTDTRVWTIFAPRQLGIQGKQGCETIEAEQLILAPGAYEYVPPFPGWTLPGVMTPGGAQQMVKTMGVCPGKRVLIAGTGPFLLVVAEQLRKAGMEVVGVVEAVTTAEAIRALPRLLLYPNLLGEGLGYLHRLRRARVPMYRGEVVVEARGDAELREVVVARCDGEWRGDPARRRTFAVDTLCIAYGFVPRAQLAQLAGCRMRFVHELGGWIPELDENLQTSAAGVRVAGDGGGVAGALVAQEEGALAGLAASLQLGALDSLSFERNRRPVIRRLRRLRRFREALDRLSRIRPGLTTIPTPDTIVCRCEELTQAEVETGIAFGGTDLRTLKVMTRLGMGACQGSMCWPAASRWIAVRSGKSIEEIGPLSVRPPIMPLCVGDLAREEGVAAGPEADSREPSAGASS
ncbi:MAG TPA: NAD(P)/FAD-dependent oxidoreductase [Pirellulales bacterium]|nr:NAD(P)/FAD-dependent oxidoreductase [Pirellulales bacterium]